MAFSLNASSFTSGYSSGGIGCSLIAATNNTPSVSISGNTQINPYPSGGMGYNSICFWMSFNTNYALPIYGSFYPGGGTATITASQLNSIVDVSGFPGRFFIGQSLLILFYSSQTYTNDYVTNGSLPQQFIIPAPPGGSNNIYGGIQTHTTFVVQPCGIPTSLNGTSNQPSQVPLTWTAPSDNGGSAITKYIIQYNTTGSAPWNNQVITSSSATSYTITGLINGTKYYFKVAAINGYCNNDTEYGPTSGLFSETYNATPATIPNQVKNVETTSGPNIGNISVSWTAPINNVGAATSSYTLQYMLSGSGNWTTILGIVDTNRVIQGLANASTYDIRVAAVNSLGTGPYSSSVLGMTFAPPKSPTDLQGTRGNTQVSLKWTAPNNNGGTPITGYLVERSTSSSGQWTQTLTGSTEASFVVTGLTNGILYDFRVSGVNIVGTGTPSTTLSVTPSTIPGPSVITSSASYSNQQSLVKWAEPVNTGGAPILSYNLQYSSTGSTGSWLPTTPYSFSASTISYTFTGLTNGTRYYFQVQAVNLNGLGPYSAQTSNSTAIPATTPDPPINLSTTAGINSISVSWNPPVNNGGAIISSYTLQYRTGAGNWTTIPLISQPQYIITGLNQSTTYDIQVVAINVVGAGSYSIIVNGQTDSTPNNPTDLQGSYGNAQVSLKWTAPNNNGGTPIVNYLVEYKLASTIVPPGSWSQVYTGSNGTAYIVTGLTNGLLYDFRVLAVNGVGIGSQSIIIKVMPSTTPGLSVITSSVSCDNQQILVTWAAPVDTGGLPILSYNLQYSSTSSTGSWLPTIPDTFSASTRSYRFTGLTNGTQYYFQVRANNSNGLGSYSAQTSNSTATPSITPQSPSSFTATATMASSIALSWSAPTGLANTGGNSAIGYLIYWSEFSSTGTSIPPIYSYDTTTGSTPPATTYTITGLTHTTLYEIQISSISCSGIGPISGPSLYVTTSSIPPSEPTNVAISGCNTGHTNSVMLTWTAPVDDGGSPIINYIIYYRTTSPTGIWYTYNTNSGSTTAIVPIPSSNTSYDFKLAAQNNAGVSVFSSPIVSSSSYNPPTAPTNLVATNDLSGYILLTWTLSTQEAPQTISYYVIEYKICEFGGWIPYPTTIPSPTNSATINNSNIANNLPYLFRVYAVNSCGARSDLSNVASATSYNNDSPTRLWTRFNSNCSGNITSYDSLTRNMLRKGQVLQYPVVGTLQYSRATLWSMAAKNQLTRQKAWASESQQYTYPNITNINNEPGVGLRQTPTSLVCWTPPPTIICNPTSSSDVPGNSTTLCISKNAPFDNYRHPNTYASGGTKWPIFFSK
jgi:titin